MNESWQIALFGWCFGGIGTVVLGALWGFFFLWTKIGELKNDVVRLSTQFEDWLNRAGELAAKALHSPDNHLKIDDYLDKYLDQHYDMSVQEWVEFRSVLQPIAESEESEKISKLEKVQAEFLMALCDHKLSRAGITHTKKLT